MTQYEMEQNLENHRFQSSGAVESIITMGIANPALENVVRNSLAKDSSAAFQMALDNGGIYRNNTFLGGNGLYGALRKVIPKKFKTGENAHYGGIGPIQFNKFSAGTLDATKGSKLSGMAQNIADNNPNWSIEDDIIATGFGFQNQGYKDFFDQLHSIGFQLDKSKSADVNLSKEQYKIYQGLKNNSKTYSYIDDEYKNILSSTQSIDDYVNKKLSIKETILNKKEARIKAKLYDKDKKVIPSQAKELKKVKEKKIKLQNEVKTIKEKMYNEKAAVDFLNESNQWNIDNLSDDLYNQLHDDFSKIIKDGINLSDTKQTDAVIGFLDDFFKLEKSFNKFGKRTASTFNKAYSAKIAELQKKLSIKNITRYASQNGIKFSEAKLAIQKEIKESVFEFIKDNADDAFRNLSDDVGRHFATKTGFQKFFGNKAMSFLTGIKGGIASFLWQLPVTMVTATASINQENAIQNFVSSYLYNPKTKEMYNNEATNRSMQIASNIHFSNIQDTQSIIIKHNTAERYLNDLDPINIDNDYSSKSFDLNPRNN